MRPPLVILAGGQGTRLREITGPNVPKPMVDVFGKPFLYWLIKDYVRQGFTGITISMGYKWDVIYNYPWPWLLDLDYDAAYGDHLKNYDANYKDGCIVVNGDTWITSNLPIEDGPWILSCGDTDAGAQRVGIGKIKIHHTNNFYDIGTPTGLEVFKEYFKTHLDTMNQSSQTSPNQDESPKGGTYVD